MVFKHKIYSKFLEWKNTSLGKSALLYEIDFILSRKNKVYPIEVKSSSYKTHSSLDAFCKKIFFSNSRKIFGLHKGI